jgi:hypothetical protein
VSRLAPFILLCTLLALASPSIAVIPLPTTPDWESTPNGQYGTGLGVGDLNGDGWVDLVVANGNDMARQRVTVYLNNGAGSYPVAPTWSSADIDYHGHLDLADVDGDGFLDCAVAVYLGAGGFGTKGRVKLYRGVGDGTFSANPVWQSADTFYCFSLAFGDINMDGRPDLACATGDDYNNNAERRRVYRNLGAALETSPSWMSTENEYSLDATWADFNNDGYLDLAFAGTSCPNRIYFSQGGILQTTAGWSSSDASIYANTVAAGDVDGDGWTDLAIADNNQLGGSGRFKLYRNQGNGTLATQPTWQSVQAGYGSQVSLIDVDEDGDLDLSTGMWWGPVRVYENQGGTLTVNPTYSSATSSVIENEVWEDVDNDGLQRGLGASWTGNGTRKLFNFPTRPVRQILSMTVGDLSVPVSSLLLDADDAWVVLPSAPATGAVVRVSYVSSADVDLALSNWDTSEGEYLFRNLRNPSATPEPLAGAIRLILSPNPSRDALRLRLEDQSSTAPGDIEIFDPAGRRVRVLAGMSTEGVWDGRDASGRSVPSGVYFIRWTRGSGVPITGRVIRE